MVTSLPVFALAFLYCAWDHYRRCRLLRAHVLRQRVAYLLWVVANLEDEPGTLVGFGPPPYARQWAPPTPRTERTDEGVRASRRFRH